VTSSCHDLYSTSLQRGAQLDQHRADSHVWPQRGEVRCVGGVVGGKAAEEASWGSGEATGRELALARPALTRVRKGLRGERAAGRGWVWGQMAASCNGPREEGPRAERAGGLCRGTAGCVSPCCLRGAGGCRGRVVCVRCWLHQARALNCQGRERA